MALVPGEFLSREIVVFLDEFSRECQETDVVQESGKREIPEFVPWKAQSQAKTVGKVGRTAAVSLVPRGDAFDQGRQFPDDTRDRAPMDAAAGGCKIKRLQVAQDAQQVSSSQRSLVVL
jgi:hypothetical protein